MDERREHADLAEALEAIDPASLSYQEWADVGMALQASGYGCEVWDAWSRRDPKRYHEGECARKWRGFSSDGGVTGATVAKMARDRGWVPAAEGPGEALAWDGTVEIGREPGRIIDPTWLEDGSLPEGEWHPARELADYISALFEADEFVGYVCDSFERDGRHTPASAGSYARTAGDIVRELEQKGDVAHVMGAYDPEAGAWIRFNPLDGKGAKNTDVTDFRHALVESDTLPRERQLAIIRALELPCAAIVDSGGKSIHAVVRVDAADYAEYRKRVDALYEVCRKNGLEPDTQNKNPSRLSRMPGVERAGERQRLVDVNAGKGSWDEWWEWVQETSDDLPEPTSLADVWDDMPELAPPLIDGVLRQGHKMLLAGPSKAGKSFALIELCCAIAEGREWFGWPCAQGRVLYVNLELDPASALHRFRDVYAALGWEPAHVGDIDVWNLRGRSVPMDRLAGPLIRRALKTRPIAVVIDPIYKVITGDENSADQMAAFCNQFDKVAQQVGCAVIYCHHHSKGLQGQKRSMDRASGSGVFARDPDALLDMAPLALTDDCRAQRLAERAWDAAVGLLDARCPGWAQEMPDGSQGVAARAADWVRGRGDKALAADIADAAARVAAQAPAWTAWRIEGTLREFQSFRPLNLWFEYPRHLPDSTGALADLRLEGDPKSLRDRQRTGNAASTAKYQRDREEKIAAMRAALKACAEDGVRPTRRNILDRIGEVCGKEVTDNMIVKWTTKESEKWSPFHMKADKTDEVYDDESDIKGKPMGWHGEEGT